MPSIIVTVGHISDLHFGSAWWPTSFSLRQTKHLTEHLAQYKPDLILCTGDVVNNAPNVLSLRRARNFLRQLRQSCGGCRLLVVPGNHDCALWGILGPKVVCGFLFRRMMKEFLGLVDTAHFDSEKRITVFGFDSNPAFAFRFNAARGRIKDSDIKNFYAQVETLKNNKTLAYDDSIKIAALHHHPIPIPYSGSDTHLVLNDAASLLMELAKYDIDLVIHGHKHFSAMAKILFKVPEGEYGLPVLAAGSASKASGGDPKGNSYNLIRVWDDGVIDVQTFFVQPVGTFVPSTPVTCQSLERASEKIFLRERQRQGCEIDTLDYQARIDKFGDAYYNFVFKGLRATGGEPLKRLQLVRRTDFGYFHEFRIVRGSVGLAGARAETKFSEEADQNKFVWSLAECAIDLGRELTRDSDPVELDVNFPLFAGYAMTLEEQKQRKQSFCPGMEYAGIQILYPIRRLVITVESQHYRFTPENTGVSVFDKNGKRQSRLEDAATEDMIVNDHRILLRLQYPRLGYGYDICWKLPDDTPRTICGDALPWRRFLLGLSTGGASSRFATAARPWLEDLQRQFAQRYTTFDPAEQIDASIMVFNDELGVLEMSACLAPPDSAIWNWKELRPGYGLAGRALKCNDVVMYFRKRVPAGMWPIYISPSDRLGKAHLRFHHEVLISLPLHRGGTARQDTIGVINLGTNSSGTRLYEVIENKEETAQLYKWLMDVEKAVESKIVELSRLPE